MQNIFDIQKGHSYEEYRLYFGDEYDRGEVLGFTIDQKYLMDPNRQYWDLADENGVRKYFELPKHVKPFTKFSPYCFNRILHRRPARLAILIVASVGVASVTCSFIGKSYFGKKDFDIDVKTLELDKCAVAYKRWREKKGENADVSKSNLPIFTIANWAMGQTLYDANTEGAELKEKVMTVGHGNSDTNILISHVVVDISNCFIQNSEQTLEESISFGSMSLTRFGKRDYYNDLGNKEVSNYLGDASSSTTCKWNNNPEHIFPTKDDYMAEAGKNPAQPFLYNINEETVLTDKVYDENPTTGEQHFGNSKCESIKDNTGKITGYVIDMDLHNVKSVTRYVKRMTYLSGQTPDYFTSVHLKFITDDDLCLLNSEVEEHYSVKLMDSSGWLKTKYFYGDKALTIPKKTESIDYSKY